MPLRVVAYPGAHRLPAPPSTQLCHRATVAAVAAGAVVAGAHAFVAPTSAGSTPVPVSTNPAQLLAATVVPAPTPAPEPVAVGTLLPVAAVSGTDADAPYAVTLDAIGGDQLLPDTLAVGALDAATQVDVANLTKAVEIGRELAEQAEVLDAALADGAADAYQVGETTYVRPVTGRLTSVFGARWGTSHQGIDIANSIGTPIYAVTDGVVVDAGPASGFGMWVVLRHTDGTRSVYGHVNRVFVEKGQEVAAGEEIAEVGNRGRSTGPHLHMEIWDTDGSKVNPLTWLNKRGVEY